jgi:hypothetical protein
MELEIKKVCEGFWSCISPDAYLQTFGTIIGSALGAFLGALGAYLIFIKDKKNSKQETQKLFKRKYLAKNGFTRLTIEQLEIFLDKKSNSPTKKPGLLIKLSDKAREQLLTIPEESIPDKVFWDFFSLCEDLSLVSASVSLIEYGIPGNHHEDLEETLQRIKLNKQELETKMNL